MKRLFLVVAFLCVFTLVPAANATVTKQLIDTVPNAIYLTAPPAPDSRIFVVDRTGIIWVIQPNGDRTEFMDMSSLVRTPDASEQGMLSLAFDPNYASNGHFYVNYNAPVVGGATYGNVQVSEFTNPNPEDNDASTSTLRNLLTIPHDQQGNHNGGTVNFGPDGLLYVSVGDGGGNGDPSGNGQNLSQGPSVVDGVNHSPLLGKLLRIDPNGTGLSEYSAGPGQPFTIGAAPQIFAYGLRNPFRWSFDKLTGDLIIGDVGQSTREEVDFVPHAQLAPGINFGWNNREGSVAFSGGKPLFPGSVETKPVYDYGRDVGSTVIGGYVVRDPSSPLYGQYIFGDFGSNQLSSACLAQPAATGVHELGLGVQNLNSFGEDSAGHLYAVANAGEIYRINATGQDGSCPPPGSGGTLTPPATPAATLKLTASKRQPVAGRGYVKVVASCNAACSLSARATFKRRGVKKSLKSSVLRKSLAAGQRVTLKIKLSKATRKALRRALREKRKTTATVTISGASTPGSVKLTVSG